MARVFVVGASRSGTTLVQRMLTGHPRVHTFPETGLFLRLLGMRGMVLPWARAGLSAGEPHKSLVRLREHERSHFPHLGLPELPPRRWRLCEAAREAVGFLDRLARAHGATGWVEKTPRHVLHAARILSLVPGATMVHVIRDGREVVASMVERARRFPDRFGRQRDPRYGIRLWNRAMQSTRAAIRGEGHVAVRYESLAAEPARVMAHLGSLLDIGLDARPGSPKGRPHLIAGPGEAWKREAFAEVRPPRRRFDEVFTRAERRDIEGRLRLDLYEELAGSPGTGPIPARAGCLEGAAYPA